MIPALGNNYFQSSIASEDYEVRIMFTFLWQIWTDVSNNWMATLRCRTDVSNKSICTGNPGSYSQEAILIQVSLW